MSDAQRSAPGRAWSRPVVARPRAGAEFFHDLECRSGFGDRLLDLWAAVTIARLHDPRAAVEIRWDEGLTFAGFVGIYATELFALGGCSWVESSPPGAEPVTKLFGPANLNERTVVPLANGARQIVLRSGKHWANTHPDRLREDLACYGLDPALPLQRIGEAYRGVARSTAPDPRIEPAIPGDVARRVGVHVRLQDKLVVEENAFEMDEATWQAIERDGRVEIERCIDRGEPLFVCSDDLDYRGALVERIRSRGGDVAVASAEAAPGAELPGYDALVDFFALSRCARILQLTKFSTFSIAAALVGDAPLVNFYRGGGGAGHLLDLWRSVLPEGSRIGGAPVGGVTNAERRG